MAISERFFAMPLHFLSERTLKRSIAYRSAVSSNAALPVTAGSIETGPWQLRFRRPSRVHSRGRSVTEKSAYNRINSSLQSSRRWMHRNGLFMSRKLAFIISIIDQVSSRMDESIHPLPFRANGKHPPFILYPLSRLRHLLHFCCAILRTQRAPSPWTIFHLWQDSNWYEMYTLVMCFCYLILLSIEKYIWYNNIKNKYTVHSVILILVIYIRFTYFIS